MGLDAFNLSKKKGEGWMYIVVGDNRVGSGKWCGRSDSIRIGLCFLSTKMIIVMIAIMI